MSRNELIQYRVVRFVMETTVMGGIFLQDRMEWLLMELLGDGSVGEAARHPTRSAHAGEAKDLCSGHKGEARSCGLAQISMLRRVGSLTACVSKFVCYSRTLACICVICQQVGLAAGSFMPSWFALQHGDSLLLCFATLPPHNRCVPGCGSR